MSYSAAVEGLLARGHELLPAHRVPRRKFDLEQMRLLAAELGHPERQFRSVLIAGTNGKGSTAATLASILQSAGYRTGLYTSPHLSRLNERIQINRELISEDHFARLYFRVDEAGARLLKAGKLAQPPSFFEAMTAVAFAHFAEQNVDLAVLEVGMGGRLDATNIVDPLLSIITDISLDHMEWLGQTVAEIAREKAGILRPGGTMITLPQHPDANRVLGECAMTLEVNGINAAEYMPQPHASTSHAFRDSEYDITLMGSVVRVSPALAGVHQHRNTALAIAAAVELCNTHGYKLNTDAILSGINTANWPGRLELFQRTGQRCAVLLDVAHNPAGAWTLRSAVTNLPGFARRTLLFGCLRDKAYAEMAQILFPVFDCVLLSPVDSSRSASAGDLLAAAAPLGTQAQAVDSPRAGLNLALRDAAPADLVVCAGSIYLVGPIRDDLIAPSENAL
ncbi:MAG TPA: folylpolyglutamate synthase/dihydrofolate synthase family protein [Acidobacteriaceae bacterium]|nr:folylpolyglutamate synthase/dihydrofolate synthase family protein [Acidobacteriaceae bacterium]